MIINNYGAHCSSCALKRVCLPGVVDGGTVRRIEDVIRVARPLRRGQLLYRSGDHFSHLYAIRSGAVKIVMNDAMMGEHQILGLGLAGDVIGFDGVVGRKHAFDVIAVEDSSVCLVPYEQIASLCRDTPLVQSRINEAFSQKLIYVARRVALLGMRLVRARVVMFIMDLSRRNVERGLSRSEFSLRLTRTEMANYLGTTLESVSRTLSSMASDGLIRMKGKQLIVMDFDGLMACLPAMEVAQHPCEKLMSLPPLILRRIQMKNGEPHIIDL